MSKLVRDGIPFICPDGKFTRVFDEELKGFVTDKIMEEAQETIEAAQSGNKHHLTEELADLMEIAAKLAQVHGISWDDVEATRAAKNSIKGKFDSNYVLLNVEEVCSKKK